MKNLVDGLITEKKQPGLLTDVINLRKCHKVIELKNPGFLLGSNKKLVTYELRN
jgi:hypothetical protein